MVIYLGQFLLLLSYWSKIRAENVPVIIQTPKSYFPKYGTLELSCQADGDPSPDISWYDAVTKQKMMNNIGTNGFGYAVQIMKTGQQSRLMITYSESRQEYKVYCNASNSLGYAVSPPATTGLAYLNGNFQLNPPIEKIVNSDSMVQLSCKPPDGRPQPTVSWFKNGQSIDPTHNSRYIITIEPDLQSYYSLLKILKTNQEDSGSYHCFAENAHFSSNSTTSILKVISVKNYQKTSEDFKFTVSTNAKIQCPIESDRTVHWTRQDSQAIDTSRASFEGSNLRINNIQMSDSGKYICRIKSSTGESSEALLNVIVQAPATFLQTPEDKTILEGDDVTFKCVVSGIPLPEVYWELSGLGVLFPGDLSYPRFRVNNDGSLNIENTQLSDTGKYTCNCHSSLDARHSSANLYVKKRELAHYPVISLPPQNQTLIEGSTATFRCEVSHMDAIITWYRGPQNELLQAGDRISLPTRGALQLKKIDPTRDTNIYTCEASLAADGMKTRWTAFLRVIYPDSRIQVVTPLNDESQLPVAPVLDTPTERTADSVTLSWTSSGQVKYWIEYVRFNSREGWVIYKKDWPYTRITIKNLLPNSWYQFLVRSHISKGLSRASVPTEYVKTLSRESSRPASKFDIEDRKFQSIFSQIQINIKTLTPIIYGKVKLEWQVTAPTPKAQSYIEGFKIRYNMVSLLRCLDEGNQAQIKRKLYCSFRGRSTEDIRGWITQSDWWPITPASNVPLNLTSGLVEFRFALPDHIKKVKSIITGLNPFSCYEITVEAYSENPSVTSHQSQSRNSLMLEDRPSQPPQNIRTVWSKTKNILIVHYYLPPKHTWNGFISAIIIHIFANESRTLLRRMTFNDTFRKVEIQNLDDKKSYSLHLSLYNCHDEGIRSPPIYVPVRSDEPSPYEQQAWFIPVIVVGTLIFWVLLCCLVVYLCCIRFQLISKSPKFKSKDCEINLEPLMNVAIKDSINRQNKLCIKPQESNNFCKSGSEALYSATSIVNQNQYTTESNASGTCTPYASASIVDSMDNSSDIGTFAKFYTGSIIDELGPAPSTMLPPYLTYTSHYTPYSISSAIMPYPMTTVQVDNNMMNSTNVNSSANTQTFCNNKDDNFQLTAIQNSKFYNPSSGPNNWPPSVKMGISQLPGSSSGTSSSGNTSQKKYIDHMNGSINAISCSAVSPATLGSATPSPSAIGTESGGSNAYQGPNKERKTGEESPKSTVHYDVIPNQETCDEFCEYSSQSSDSNNYDSGNELQKPAQIPITIDTNVSGNKTQGQQHSPGYSTDSVTYSAVPHRPYPKSSRKKQMRQYHTHVTTGNSSGFTHKSKL